MDISETEPSPSDSEEDEPSEEEFDSFSDLSETKDGDSAEDNSEEVASGEGTDEDGFGEFESLGDDAKEPDFEFEFDEAPGEKASVTEETFSAENGFEIDFSVFEEIPEPPARPEKTKRKGKKKK